MHTIATSRVHLGRRVVAVVLITAALGIAALVGAAPADAHSPHTDRVQVTDIDDGRPTGASMLRRTDHGVHALVRTTGLSRHHAYTVWAVIFNNPAACDGPCGSDDLANPDVGGVSTLLTGKVARWSRTWFVGRLAVGDALTDPKGAEIHFIVRTHGPVIPELRREQITTLNGGCPPNVCANVQLAVRAP